jgi:hypothetical protein
MQIVLAVRNDNFPAAAHEYTKESHYLAALYIWFPNPALLCVQDFCCIHFHDRYVGTG